MHTVEPLVSESRHFEFEIAVGKLKIYKSSGIDKIPAEPIQAWCNALRSKIHKLVHCIWNKEELPQQWKEYITIPIYKRAINCQ